MARFQGYSSVDGSLLDTDFPEYDRTSAPVTPEDHGAVGDGTTDDTAALNAAMNALQSGGTLVLAQGKTYRHTTQFFINKEGVIIRGGGTLLATAEQDAAVRVTANNVTIDGPTLRATNVTQRWLEFEKSKLVVHSVTGFTARNLTIDGAGGAGIQVYNSSGFLIEDVMIRDTRADGIHMHGMSHTGRVLRAVCHNTGDDGVSVVSYNGEVTPCRNIDVVSPRVYNSGARGISVVGGESINFTDFLIYGSNAAGVIIASEGGGVPTKGTTNVAMRGGQLIGCNRNGANYHGAILCTAGGANSISNISFYDILVTELRTNADGALMQLTQYDTATVTQARFERITFRNCPQMYLWTKNVPNSAYRLNASYKDGTAITNELGF